MRSRLSERDLAVLRIIADDRYLTTNQIQAFCFDGHATPLSAARVSRRVLQRLASERLIVSLERRIGGVRAGSASTVWQLGPVGDRLLRTDPDTPRRRSHEPGRLFLDHCLAVAEAHLALLGAHRVGQLELLDVQTEPACWRPYQDVGGARLVLQPDLHAVTGAGEYEDRWFIEVDRGTEHRRRLLSKCGRYEAYRRSGQEQTAHGSFPLVVWIMPDQARADLLMHAVAQANGLDNRLFRITTMADFAGLIAGGAA